MNHWIDSNKKKRTIRQSLIAIIEEVLQDDGWNYALAEHIVSEEERDRTYELLYQVIERTASYIERRAEWIDGEDLV